MAHCQQCGKEIGITKMIFCVNCKAERNRKNALSRYHQNKEEINRKRRSPEERQKRNEHSKKPEVKVRMDEYRKNNRDEINRRGKEYRNLHKDELKKKRKEKNQTTNIAQKEKIRLKRKEYRKTNKLKIKESKRKYKKEITIIYKSQMPFKGQPFQLFLIDVENFANNEQLKALPNPLRQSWRDRIFRKLIQPQLIKDSKYLVLWFGGEVFLSNLTNDDHNLYFPETETKPDGRYISADVRMAAKTYEYFAKYPKQIDQVWIGSADWDLYPIVEVCITNQKEWGVLAPTRAINHNYTNIAPSIFYFLS
jgi:hypothetical protein